MPAILENLILVSLLALYTTGAVAVAIGMPRIMREGQQGRLDVMDFLFYSLLVLGWPGLLLASKFGFVPGKRSR